jgi:hypothetical protein
MKKSLILILCLFQFSVVFSQVDSTQLKNDVSSIDSILAAMYDVISGPAGPRDWNRFRNLYHAKAYMGAIYNKPDGTMGYRTFTPEEYIVRSTPFMNEKSFYEKELGREVMHFKNLISVFSAYQYETPDKKQRGINSVQLIFSENRWWISCVIWEEESKDNPLPEFILKK